MNRIKKENALALSGGGFRATLFALGSLRRLNEFGLLSRINRITSVSGGSITSAYLAMKQNEFNFSCDTGVAENFETTIAKPLQHFCSKSLDIMAVISGLTLPFNTIGDKVAKRYAKRLFGTKTLQDIPASGHGPEFIFYTTSLQTGVSVRFSKVSIADYKVGALRDPQLSLEKVVGASSAFPPFFSPVIIKFDPQQWKKTKGAVLYDNLDLRKNWFWAMAEFMIIWDWKRSGMMILKRFLSVMPERLLRLTTNSVATGFSNHYVSVKSLLNKHVPCENER